ncbi:MAG: hypothetical protein ACI3XQ_11310 [Eubacteriales bacterium]
MTNAQIIFNASVDLMEKGILSGTGRFLDVNYEDGTVGKIEIPEDIHTFAGWKSLGYCVKKGQKAIAQIEIWKHTTKFLDENVQDENTAAANREINEQGGIQKMFMKKAFFFKSSQVEPLKG